MPLELLPNGMTVTEKMAFLARALDTLNELEIGALRARGTADAVLREYRARLDAKRAEILAGVWLKLEGQRG